MVSVRSVQQQAGMDGSFAGRQLEAFRGAVLADIVNGLVQDIVFLGITGWLVILWL